MNPNGASLKAEEPRKQMEGQPRPNKKPKPAGNGPPVSDSNGIKRPKQKQPQVTSHNNNNDNNNKKHITKPTDAKTQPPKAAGNAKFRSKLLNRAGEPRPAEPVNDLTRQLDAKLVLKSATKPHPKQPKASTSTPAAVATAAAVAPKAAAYSTVKSAKPEPITKILQNPQRLPSNREQKEPIELELTKYARLREMLRAEKRKKKLESMAVDAAMPDSTTTGPQPVPALVPAPEEPSQEPIKRPQSQESTDVESQSKDGMGQKEAVSGTEQKPTMSKKKLRQQELEAERSRLRELKRQREEMMADPQRILAHVLQRSSYREANLSEIINDRMRVSNEFITNLEYPATVGATVDGLTDLNCSVFPSDFNGTVNISPSCVTALQCINFIPKHRPRGHWANKRKNPAGPVKRGPPFKNKNDRSKPGLRQKRPGQPPVKQTSQKGGPSTNPDKPLAT